MRRYHHLIEGVLQPEEINNLQKIFDVVIAQPWFDLTDFSRETFASELIKIYRRGIVDFDRLHHLATLIALAHFSRDMPEEKRKAMDLLHGVESELDNNRTSEAPKPES
ncbi:MAG: hypothetical protein E6Q76_16195 [Rhizobium sp.]|nr:MAG: hypothetical protein E6Q76_16195 [Rhizobium sp.]